ncbi:Inositol phosphorylceramide synthase regulatory subunit-like protein [Hapsidospora chrysogenum ATCC 11550]|uniref:Inositol phosphorylceramide synthase regulatory subunit-like protein n=1 Tax=Hapsidospora chrysogenum (strain ATCC 11550 / CBS 779.69 / DSM 880 / IAM 14645 / JCM 23072 / IMI 49137) TaxID=857340 RepID=A0A086SYA9_HAPC1|nr:Inositol phosphorylceramide synthase regulatory subunit-like protein [Hapsidospora chrysogenum ATCC 11550]
MSRFTSLYLRVPRPKTLFGFISLQTATELITLALIFNKVTGVYGLLAILTGYQLSFMQLSTYLYSIAVLVALVYLMPHIRRRDSVECLALAWLYVADTIINTFDTLVFGLEWYFASSALEDNNENIPDMVAQGIEKLRQESAQHGAAVPRETASSMVLIAALTLVRVYFVVVVMAFAREVLQKQMQVLVIEGRSEVVDGEDGPFGRELPDGDGRRGRLGRMMVSVGRGYWLEEPAAEQWADDVYPSTVPSRPSKQGVQIP